LPFLLEVVLKVELVDSPRDLADVLEHLEEVLLNLLVDSFACVFDHSSDLESVLLPRFRSRESQLHLTLVDIELAGIREHVVEDLLVDLDIQHYSKRAHLLRRDEVSLDLLRHQ